MGLKVISFDNFTGAIKRLRVVGVGLGVWDFGCTTRVWRFRAIGTLGFRAIGTLGFRVRGGFVEGPDYIF